jgi:NADPH:quinone reductase-like Zn-dependent oxidoreductase
LGAALVVTRDGKTPGEIVAEIRAAGEDDITRCIDLVGTETASHCLDALSRTQKALFTPLARISNKACVPEHISVETVEMKRFVLDNSSSVYSKVLNDLVADGKVVLPDTEVMTGGLDVIAERLEKIEGADFTGKGVVMSMRYNLG